MIGSGKRLSLSLGLFLTLAGIGHTQEAAPPERDHDRAEARQHQANDPSQKIELDGASYRLSGPYKHDNLEVYLIHGQVRQDRDFITLDEGLRSGQVVVREHRTVSVSRLEIDNRSRYPLYLQEGDRLSGGKQDRTVQTPLVIRPRSGPVELAAFCIEANRWSAGSKGGNFGATSTVAAAPRAVRVAAKIKRDQSRVWSEVEDTKKRYAKALDAGNTNSSLNESLDSRVAKQAAAKYLEPLKGLAAEHEDAIGVAFAMNGQIEEINVYAGRPLLAKMYPRLLESYAMEAAVSKVAPREPRKDDGGVPKADAAPAPPIDPRVHAQQVTEKNDAADKTLKLLMNSRFNGHQLSQVVADLEKITNLKFKVDWDALETAGVQKDKRIVARMRRTPVATVISEVLKFAAGPLKPDLLDYTIANGEIHISTRQGVAAVREGQEAMLAWASSNAPPQEQEHRDIIATPSLDLQAGAPADAVAVFMRLRMGREAEARAIDATNRLDIQAVRGGYLCKSTWGGLVVHRQWLRGD